MGKVRQGKNCTGETRQRKAQQSKAREGNDGNDGNEQGGKAREGNETRRREGRQEENRTKIGGDATFCFSVETSEILHWNSIFMFIVVTLAGTAAVPVLWVLQMGTARYCGYCGYCAVPAVPVGTAGYCWYCGYCTG